MPPSKSYVRRRHWASIRGAYNTYNGVELVPLFNHIDHVSKCVSKTARLFHFKRSTLSRLYHRWCNIGRPPTYILNERRGRRTIMNDEQESMLTALINYRIDQGDELHNSDVRDMAINIYQQTYTHLLTRRCEHTHTYTVDQSASYCIRVYINIPALYLYSQTCFHASDGWLSEFAYRHFFRSHRPRNISRPIITSETHQYELEFLKNIKNIITNNLQPKNKIFNMDETHIRKQMGPRHVWSRVGDTWRTVHINGDMKKGITTCITISAAGDVLPTYYIKKGKTARTLASLHCDGINELATYTNNGWATSTAMIDYLYYIIAPQAPCVLVWDVHRSHTHNTVKWFALSHNIELLFIPAGMTHIYQPLDTHINGIIKSKLMAYHSLRRRQQYDGTNTDDITMSDIIKTTTHILQNIFPKDIRMSFTESLFTPANNPPTRDVNIINNDDNNNSVSALQTIDEIMNDVTNFIRQHTGNTQFFFFFFFFLIFP